MKVIKITISLELFERLFKEGHIKTGEYELDKIDDKGYDYSDDEQWEKAKSASIKAYKKLKEIEFNLRHKK
jgi:hypothetical protein